MRTPHASNRSITPLAVVAVALALSATGASVITAHATSSPPDGTVPPAAETWPTVPPFTAGPPTTLDPTVPTTISPAAQAPLVTLVPLGPEAQEVANAMYEARVVFVEMQMNPHDPSIDARMDSVYAPGSQVRAQADQIRTELIDLGLRVYLSSALPWTLTVGPVEFYAEPYLRAEITTCYVDTVVLYEPNAAPNGDDIIVNDGVAATAARVTLIPLDGSWLYWYGERIGEPMPGATSC